MREAASRLILFVALTITAVSPAGQARAAEPEVLGYLPREGVEPACAAEHFAGTRLFDYMNGGAEVYLGYGFVDLGVRDYRQGEAKATVAVYRMRDPAGAYGIWAANARGEPKDVGVPANLARGMLSFHKGRFYVRVVAKSDPAGAQPLLLDLGKKTAVRLPGTSETPPVMRALPDGAVSGTLRFLTDPRTARTVWFDGEGDLLLTKGTRAATAFYPGDDADIQLTRIDYPDTAAAEKACKALAKKLSLEVATGEGACRAAGKTPDDVHAALRAEGKTLRWATGVPDPAAAKAWLAKIK